MPGTGMRVGQAGAIVPQLLLPPHPHRAIYRQTPACLCRSHPERPILKLHSCEASTHLTQSTDCQGWLACHWVAAPPCSISRDEHSAQATNRLYWPDSHCLPKTSPHLTINCPCQLVDRQPPYPFPGPCILLRQQTLASAMHAFFGKSVVGRPLLPTS